MSDEQQAPEFDPKLLEAIRYWMYSASTGKTFTPEDVLISIRETGYEIHPAGGWDVYIAGVRAYARSGHWRKTPWRGGHVEASPADLWAIIEIVRRLQPKRLLVVNECAEDGMAEFFGTLLDDMAQGRVHALSTWDEGVPRNRRVKLDNVPDLEADEWPVEMGPGLPQVSAAWMRLNPERSTDSAIGLLRKAGDLIGPGGYLLVPGTIDMLLGVETCIPETLVRFVNESNGQWQHDPDPERHGYTLMSGGFVRRTR